MTQSPRLDDGHLAGEAGACPSSPNAPAMAGPAPPQSASAAPTAALRVRTAVQAASESPRVGALRLSVSTTASPSGEASQRSSVRPSPFGRAAGGGLKRKRLSSSREPRAGTPAVERDALAGNTHRSGSVCTSGATVSEAAEVRPRAASSASARASPGSRPVTDTAFRTQGQAWCGGAAPEARSAARAGHQPKDSVLPTGDVCADAARASHQTVRERMRGAGRPQGDKDKRKLRHAER